ncbi:hypothetical protein BD289DRAFT_268089 [Coniella lustricola]|uniref:Uncharacterized protein n=1 Tax=Coniella lustricola TaxID=2025994 RepID=A0A2T3A711_9PEZI|nr:hypothetical protein BD289DRAFT_268089 [Coniella lustricola]
MNSPLLSTILSVFSPLHPHTPSPTTSSNQTSPNHQRTVIRWSDFLKSLRDYNMRAGDIFLDFDSSSSSSHHPAAASPHLRQTINSYKNIEDGKVNRVYLNTDGEWVPITEPDEYEYEYWDWDALDWDEDAADWCDFEAEASTSSAPVTVDAAIPTPPPLRAVSSSSQPPVLKRKRTESIKSSSHIGRWKRKILENGVGIDDGEDEDDMALQRDEQQDERLAMSRSLWRPEEMRRAVDVWRTRLADDD